jgi:hypothetical protein
MKVCGEKRHLRQAAKRYYAIIELYYNKLA